MMASPRSKRLAGWMLSALAIWPCVVLAGDSTLAPPAVKASLAMGAVSKTSSLAETLLYSPSDKPTSETQPQALPTETAAPAVQATPDPAADAETASDAGPAPRAAAALKEVLIGGATIVPSYDLATYQFQMQVRDFLAMKLGKRFHPRAEWAGTTKDFAPKLSVRRTWEPIGTVRVITVHHATEIPVENPIKMIRRIFRGHTTTRGRLDAADVGYHFFVDSKGDVWEGRDASIMGTHVGSTPNGLNNLGNIGICGLGSFAKTNPPKAMVDGVVNLTMLLSEYYGRALGVRGHDDWYGINKFMPIGGTDCPGRLEQAVMIARREMETKYHLASGDLEKMTELGENRSLVAIAHKK